MLDDRRAAAALAELAADGGGGDGRERQLDERTERQHREECLPAVVDEAATGAELGLRVGDQRLDADVQRLVELDPVAGGGGEPGDQPSVRPVKLQQPLAVGDVRLRETGDLLEPRAARVVGGGGLHDLGDVFVEVFPGLGVRLQHRLFAGNDVPARRHAERLRVQRQVGDGIDERVAAGDVRAVFHQPRRRDVADDRDGDDHDRRQPQAAQNFLLQR